MFEEVTSNKTVPGVTTASHDVTLPFPLPIRTSKGFLVFGIIG